MSNDVQKEILFDVLTNTSIEKILSFLPYFSDDNEFGKWIGGDKTDGVMTMSHLTYSDTVRDFIRTVNDTKFIVVFDWSNWDKGREIISNHNLIKEADLPTLRMLLTAAIRNDRFCQGALLIALKDGTIKEILSRLKKIYLIEES